MYCTFVIVGYYEKLRDIHHRQVYWPGRQIEGEGTASMKEMEKKEGQLEK